MTGIMSTLHEVQYVRFIISRAVLLIIRNISGKKFIEKMKHTFRDK